MSATTIYRLTAASAGNPASLDQVFAGPNATPINAACAVQVEGEQLLATYNKEAGEVSLFAVSDAAPVLKSKIAVGGDWNLLESFVLGNKPHLILYRRINGVFKFFPVEPDMSSHSSITYDRNHEPGQTDGLTMVRAFNHQGQVVIMGYDFDTGRVAMYAISVVTESGKGVAPLSCRNLWRHDWARGWTRYAFFQFGGEDFFLKTNILFPNVNIDHILDDATQGTTEVETRMNLRDANELSLVQSFITNHGDPHFAAYRPDGDMTLYSFHSDCKGWTEWLRTKIVATADYLIPVKTSKSQYFVLT